MPFTATTSYPLSPPSVSGQDITVDQMLNQPTRVTRFLLEYLDLSPEQFLLDKFFGAPSGGVQGGAVIFQKLLLNQFYTVGDVERVEPTTEFPIVSSARPSLDVATVEKWGGKFSYSEEARMRNDLRLFAIEAQQLANTITRKLNQEAVAKVETAITGMSGATTFVGQNWTNVILTGNSPTAPRSQPIYDMVKAQLIPAQQELNIVYSTLITSLLDQANLVLAYGDKLDAVLAANRITQLVASPQVATGTAYFVDAQNAGEYRVEKGLSTESWYKPETQEWWVQSFVMPVMYVDNPWAVIKVTGLDG